MGIYNTKKTHLVSLQSAVKHCPVTRSHYSDERDGVSNHLRLDCLLNRLSSTSLAFARGIHWWPVNSPHKGSVTRKMFPFDDVIMSRKIFCCTRCCSCRRIGMKKIDMWLSGVPDYFDRNKILSGYDLSHYQVPHCIRVFFYFVWFVFIHHNFQFYFKLCTYCNILDIYLS